MTFGIVPIANDVVIRLGLTVKKIMLGGWIFFPCMNSCRYNPDVIADLGGM
jgi:hypothetical protein